MNRKTWMEINLDEIEDNVCKIKKICNKKIIAVVKANAYGCGDRYILQACLDGGASMAAVSSTDEALILRNDGYEGEILILGPTDPEDIPLLTEKHISAAAYSLEWASIAAEMGCRDLSVHLAVDTGMNRIGFKNSEDLKKAFDILKNAGCQMDGIFTHFYCADVHDHVVTNRQAELFESAVKSLNYPFRWVHCDNSDAALFHQDDFSNACRIGITLYGITSYPNELHHPISLFSTVGMCKHISKGETIGYGATYTASGDEIIATLPIGYADGLIRQNQGRKVYIDGSYGEIVGRVCMDQIMVRMDHEVPLGTKAEIFGSHISVESMAEELHTIPYEIFSLITPRVTRRYIKNGKVYADVNERLLVSNTK